MGRALLVALSLLLAACETSEVVELRRILREREEALIKRRVIADNLNQYRRDHEALERRFKEAVGVGPAQVLEGKGGAVDAMATLRSRADLGFVSWFSIDGRGNWKAAVDPLEFPPRAESKVQPVTPAPAALPEPSLLSGSRGERLRLDIQRTEKEIADIGRIIGEVEQFERANNELDAKAKVLETLKMMRFGSAPGSLGAFFGGPKPLLESGRVDFVRPMGLKISGRLAPGRTKDELRAAIGEKFEILRLDERAGQITLEAQSRHH